MQLGGSTTSFQHRPHGGSFLPGLVILVGGGLLVVQWSMGQPLWVDEEMLALNLRERSLWQLAGPLWLDQSAPLGWLAVQRLVLLTLGEGERALRLLPLLCGLAMLACAAWIARRWLDTVAGTTFALLSAFGPWLSYHALELKPYSADAFLVLLLLAAAAFTLEGTHDEDAAIGRFRAHVPGRRLAAWWGLAAVGQWFANAALLVAPGCAVVVLPVLWRRWGRRILPAAVLGAAAWGLSCGLNYVLALRHSAESEALQSYWSFAMAPAGAGPGDLLSWTGRAFWSLAHKPGGVDHRLVFWLAVAAGLVPTLRRRPAMGLLLSVPPLSALAWAALRLVPMYERLSLWTVPALYLSIAVLAGASTCALRRIARRWPAWRARSATTNAADTETARTDTRNETPGKVRPGKASRVHRAAGPRTVVEAATLTLAGALGLGAAGLIVVNVARNGSDQLLGDRSGGHHEVNDREAVRWLMSHYRPGDVVVTTRLALPAVWWYGRLPFPPRPADAATRGTGAERGPRVPVFEADFVAGGGDAPCAAGPTAFEQLARPRRVLVYLGFRADDWPEGHEDVLLAGLARHGTIVSFRPYAQRGGALVIDMERPPSAGQQLPPRPWVERAGRRVRHPLPTGCIRLRPARPW